MKNFKRLISKIGWVFCIALIFGFLGSNKVLAADATQTTKIIESDYSKIYYVDANLGDDSTADGSKGKPYKTFEKLVHSIDLTVNTLIYLDKGTYTFTNYFAEKGNACTFSIVGKGGDTIFQQSTRIGGEGYGGAQPGGSKSFSLNFYDLIYTCTPSIDKLNTNSFAFKWSFYNVLIKGIVNATYGYLLPTGGSLEMHNCTKEDTSLNFLRATHGTIKLYNCYGAFTSGLSTVQTSWDTSNNVITQTPQVDSSNYKILDTNIQNNAYGVYSGDFAWGASSTTSGGIVLNIEPEKTKISLNETVSANLVIDNIKDIAAEDVRIKYDSTKLQFISADEVDGIKLVKNDAQTGELRFIVASKGLANVVEAKKILLKLNFKGIAAGDALVDVTKGRVSDGITIERDLTDAECGQATITIINNQPLGDVNNSGEFTLLDLAIDGRHFGEAPSTLTQYNTDIVVNSAIDNDDLVKIGQNMLANSNYTF